MSNAAKDAGTPEASDELTRRISKTLDKVDRMVTNHTGNQNVTNVKLEGAAHVYGAAAIAFAAGACLSAAIIIGLWVSSTISDVQETVRNNEAFIQATYQQAPEIRARFDKIKAEQAKHQEPSK